MDVDRNECVVKDVAKSHKDIFRVSLHKVLRRPLSSLKCLSSSTQLFINFEIVQNDSPKSRLTGRVFLGLYSQYRKRSGDPEREHRCHGSTLLSTYQQHYLG